MPLLRFGVATLFLITSGFAAHPQETARSDTAATGGFWSPVVPPRAQYQIACTFDAITGLLQGNQTITFRNNTERPMERLALAWSLGPKQTVSVTASGKPAALLVPSGETHINGPLLLQLPEPLKAGADLELKVEFQNSYESELGDKHALLWQRWYPQLWRGFGTHDDYALRITVPQGWGVVTSGVLEPSSGVWNGKDVRDFAAWIFDKKQYFVEQLRAGDVEVSVVHTEAGAKCARLVLETAVDVIGFYRERFGL